MKDSFVRLSRSWVVASVTLLLLGAGRAPAEPNQGGHQWYKGNTHTHSLWSHDADGFPEMIADWYKKEGYHFLALTDHNVLSVGEKWMSIDAIRTRMPDPPDDLLAAYVERFGKQWVQTRERDGQAEVRLRTLAEFRPLLEERGRFLLIQGEEITSAFGNKTVHFNALNLQQAIPPRAGESVRDTMRNNLMPVLTHEMAAGVPVVAHLNHPNYLWSNTAEDMAHLPELEFFEVFNGFPTTNQLGDGEARPGCERLWDIANTLRLAKLQAPPLYGVATDDAHQYHGGVLSPGRGWIMVRAAELTPVALLDAMRGGAFYASSGVTLTDVRFEEDTRTLVIEIEPESGASFTTVFRGTRLGYNDTSRPATDEVGAVLATRTGTSVRYRLTGNELYVRASVSSDQPPANPSFANQVKQAWTQPIGWRRHVEHPAASQLEDMAP